MNHSFHQEESEKVNIAVRKAELTVYFRFENGVNPVPCHYCKEPGQEQMVVVDRIEQDSVLISSDGKLFKDAKAKMERVFFHGRGVCERGRMCDDSFLEDFLSAKTSQETAE